MKMHAMISQMFAFSERTNTKAKLINNTINNNNIPISMCAFVHSIVSHFTMFRWIGNVQWKCESIGTRIYMFGHQHIVSSVLWCIIKLAFVNAALNDGTILFLQFLLTAYCGLMKAQWERERERARRASERYSHVSTCILNQLFKNRVENNVFSIGSLCAFSLLLFWYFFFKNENHLSCMRRHTLVP